MSGDGPLLTEAELRRLARLRIRRRRATPTGEFGDWRTGRVGSGVLFADHRDYVPGDDLRYVDWNVYARLGDLVVKRFEAEENLELLLCVDRSLSMEGPKSRAARRLAAALGYLALANMDRARLAWLPSLTTAPVTAHRGKGRTGALMDELAKAPVGGSTDHARSIGRVLSTCRRRMIAVVLSDFYDPANSVAALAALKSRGMDVVAVHMLDAADVELEPGSSLLAVDRETGQEVKVDVTKAFLESLRTSWHHRADTLERWCVKREVLYQRYDVALGLWDVLADMLGRGIAVGSSG
ncbi:MAG: DUF58 domain-containing protein [Planctomycetota bacterium]|nr:DUF58 domain-containing protein [Planctomycetota bacterium]